MGCQWSPNGHHLATAAKYQLVIRNKDMEIVHIFACNEVIEGIKWSPNSQHIVAFNFKSCLIQIFSLLDSQWKFTLEQESLEPGFTELFWAPDSQHLVIVADYQVQLLRASLCKDPFCTTENTLPLIAAVCFCLVTCGMLRSRPSKESQMFLLLLINNTALTRNMYCSCHS